jgi:hypothetical protein
MSGANDNGRREPSADPSVEETVVTEVLAAVRQIEFGSVLIKIHQGEVVGIETSTKRRLKSTTA